MRQGIFPMAERRDDPRCSGSIPVRRGIIPLDGFRISRSLRRTILRGGYRVTFDTDFAGVLDACAEREETWINDTIRSLYVALHRPRPRPQRRGLARRRARRAASTAWRSAAAFFGESMFSRERDASKVALAYLVDRLRRAGSRCSTRSS